MKGFSIHSAAKKDIKKLLFVSQVTFKETFLEDFKRPYSQKDLETYFSIACCEKVYLNYLEDSRYQFFILKTDSEETIGYSLLGPCALPHNSVTKNCGELKKLYIRRSYQGFGQGGKLLDQSLLWLSQNYANLWIGVWSENKRAQVIYNKKGFEKVGSYIFPVGKTNDYEFILKKI